MFYYDLRQSKKTAISSGFLIVFSYCRARYIIDFYTNELWIKKKEKILYRICSLLAIWNHHSFKYFHTGFTFQNWNLRQSFLYRLIGQHQVALQGLAALDFFSPGLLCGMFAPLKGAKSNVGSALGQVSLCFIPPRSNEQAVMHYKAHMWHVTTLANGI